MDDSSGKLSRRTFIHGAGGLTVASVLAGCSGGSSSNNGTEGGAETESGTTAETATDTQTKTGAGTSTETDTKGETELTETESETNTETNTETETNTTTETRNDTELTESETEDREDDEGYEGGESHQLTFGEIREQPPSTLDNLNQEYVELINTTGSTIDLSGYTIAYGDGAKYTFDDGFKLPVDQPVTVHTGSGTDSDTDVYVGRDEVALNYKGPDKVTVKNANGTVVLRATV